ncbi:hypothetical protein [Desulfosporosinus sp.]|uniref:hypothetical protein n=1 Tax=Desulfosporosinus sp. TaxID=157907 RepID=UPI0026037D03|nr:hypothetical protein [Desulfosporosinus sp.]
MPRRNNKSIYAHNASAHGCVEIGPGHGRQGLAGFSRKRRAGETGQARAGSGIRGVSQGRRECVGRKKESKSISAEQG